MTGNDSRALRDKLAAALRDQYGWLLPGYAPDGWPRDADTLLPVIAADRRNYAAQQVREFYLHAADQAARLGRRGPNAVADWLLDIGHDRAAALRDGQQ